MGLVSISLSNLLLFILLTLPVQSGNGKETRSKSSLFYNRNNLLFASRKDSTKPTNYCPSHSPSPSPHINLTSAHKNSFRQVTDEDKKDEETEYLSRWMIIFISFTVLAQLKSDLLWGEARILRKIHKMYGHIKQDDESRSRKETEIHKAVKARILRKIRKLYGHRKPDSESRSRRETEIHKTMKIEHEQNLLSDAPYDREKRNDLIFASLYTSQCKGRQTERSNHFKCQFIFGFIYGIHSRKLR